MNKTDNEKQKVIYILSNGRSGSTLLDLLLGAAPSAWTLGEAQVLFWAIKKYDYLCGCGVPIHVCNFWAPLIPDLPLEETQFPIHYFRESFGGGKGLRLKEVAALISGKTGKKRVLAINSYGALNAEYFSTVRKAAEVNRNGKITWLVDASKDPYRLLWLHKSGLFDLRVIHLMKDPRAFVYSMTKSTPSRWRAGASRMVVRWVVTNALFSYLCSRVFQPSNVMRIRYEELAGHPEETLFQLGSWLDLEFPHGLMHSFRNYPNHAVAGNPMRWQQSGIALDERWRTELSQGAANAIKIITWPLARRYGYR